MRYFKLALFAMLVTLLMTSYGSSKVKLTEGTKPGNLAPIDLLQDIITKENKYILVNFWAASDPQSRIENLKLNHILSSSEETPIRLVSISVDDSQAVFQGVIKADHLDKSNHFYLPKAQRSEIEDGYRSGETLGNWLINNEGVIVEKHLSIDEVIELL